MVVSTIPSLPVLGTLAGFRRFSVPEYHRLIEIGILTENDNLELIDGYLVKKMSRNPPHDSVLQASVLQAANYLLISLLPQDWNIRIQCAVTLSKSEPEPDVAIVRGTWRDYQHRHPSAADVGIVMEVSDSTLDGDRADKCWIYADAGIPIYWIINLVDSQIEVYTLPSGPTSAPAYGQRQDYKPGDTIPLMLAGSAVASVRVDELLG